MGVRGCGHGLRLQRGSLSVVRQSVVRQGVVRQSAGGLSFSTVLMLLLWHLCCFWGWADNSGSSQAQICLVPPQRGATVCLWPALNSSCGPCAAIVTNLPVARNTTGWRPHPTEACVQLLPSPPPHLSEKQHAVPHCTVSS